MSEYCIIISLKKIVDDPSPCGGCVDIFVHAWKRHFRLHENNFSFDPQSMVLRGQHIQKSAKNLTENSPALGGLNFCRNLPHSSKNNPKKENKINLIIFPPKMGKTIKKTFLSVSLNFLLLKYQRIHSTLSQASKTCLKKMLGW